MFCVVSADFFTRKSEDMSDSADDLFPSENSFSGSSNYEDSTPCFQPFPNPQRKLEIKADLSQPMTADPSQHRQEFIERLDTLRRNENLCDVTVALKCKEFKAHKVVLAAASPFFLSLLESNEQPIRIELDEATASVMEDVLKYVYTGNVLVTEESTHNLIATADYLLLPGLKTLACDFLKEIVTTENCVFNYYFADKYQCAELKEKSCAVTKSNFGVIMETDDFLNLDAKQVMEWVSSDDITVSAEEEVFKGIVKWVSHNKNEREKYFPDLLHEVHLSSISHEFLVNELVKEELITTNNDCLNFVLGSLKLFFNPTSEYVDKPPRKCLQTHTDVMFVCGGRKALCYLPRQDMWYQLKDMIMEHQDHAVVQCRDKIYIFDEQQVGDGESGTVAEYFMSSNNSRAAIHMEFIDSQEFSSLSVLNNDVFATDMYSGMLSRYHPDKNEWIEVADVDRYYTCGVSDGRHLYIIGGSPYTDSSMGTTTVKRFDPSENRWEELAAMNDARYRAFGAEMNGKIYVAGGCRKKIRMVLSSCEVYNPSTDEWQLIPSLNVPRHSASMVCLDGALYVAGGLSCDGGQESRELSVEMFHSEASKWMEKSTIPVNHESKGDKKKKLHYMYKACFATIYSALLKNVISI